MTLERIAGICFCIVITSAVANGQQRSETADQGPQGPGRSVIERTYAAGNLAPWRRVQTRSESGGREVVVDNVIMCHSPYHVPRNDPVVTPQWTNSTAGS